jgi:hypothetical protein
MIRLALASACLVLVGISSAEAQQITQGTPINSAGHSFYENFSFGWGFNRPPSGNFGGLQLNVMNGGGAPQPGGIAGGFAGGNGGYFGFSAMQGSRRGLSSTTPMVTTMNGQMGFIFDGSQSPFVIGSIPVVGEGVYVDYGAANTIEGRLRRGEMHIDERGRVIHGPAPAPWQQSSAARGAVAAPAPQAADDVHAPLVIGGGGEANAAPQGGNPFAGEKPLPLDELAEARATQQDSAEAELRSLLERGADAERRGRLGAARMYYEMGLRDATGPLRAEFSQRLAAIRR